MGIKHAVENHPVVWFFTILVSGFIAGITAYDTVLRIAQLEIVPRSELKQLKETAAGSNKSVHETQQSSNGTQTPSTKDFASPKQESATPSRAETESAPMNPSAINLKEYVASSNDFQFSFSGGSFQDRKLKLSITVISRNQGKRLWISHETRLIDNKGRVYNPSRTTLGTREQTFGGMAYDCPADVPVAMSVEFDNLGSDIDRFELLELNLRYFKLAIQGDRLFKQPAITNKAQ